MSGNSLGLYQLNISTMNVFDEYILDVKPYHTKILDSTTTYTHTDYINGTVLDYWVITIDEGIPYSTNSMCEVASIFGTFFDPIYMGNTGGICVMPQLINGYDNFPYDNTQPYIVLPILSINTSTYTIELSGNWVASLPFGQFIEIRNAQQSSGYYRAVGVLYANNITTVTLDSTFGSFEGGLAIISDAGFDPTYQNFNLNTGFINGIVTETINFDFNWTLQDTIYGYNFENTDNGGYDLLPYGMEYDIIPNQKSHSVCQLPSQVTVLDQGLPTETYETIITGTLCSSGLGQNVSINNSVVIPEGYDGNVYGSTFDELPYRLWFPFWENTNLPLSGQGVVLPGGNYVEDFQFARTLEVYNQLEFLQTVHTPVLGITNLIFATIPTISGFNTTNQFAVTGNFQYVLIPGYMFNIQGSEYNDGWYTIQSVELQGNTTIVTVEETLKQFLYENINGTIIDQGNQQPLGYIIPAVFSNSLVNPLTILLMNFVSDVVTQVNYTLNGPLRLQVVGSTLSDLASGLVQDTSIITPEIPASEINLASGSVTDTCNWGWQYDQWFQYLILGIQESNNSFVISANAQGIKNLPPGMEFKVINSPNAGEYYVNTSTYLAPSGVVVLTVSPTISSSASGGYVEPNKEGLLMQFSFNDYINSVLTENNTGVIQDANATINIIDAWDNTYWGIGKFDQLLQ